MKYNISITITARDKRSILNDLECAIQDGVIDELDYAVYGTDKKTAKLVKEAAEKMYNGYIKRLIKRTGDDIDIPNDSFDLLWDLAPIDKAIKQIANRAGVRERAEEASHDFRVSELEFQAAALGLKVVPEDYEEV